MRAGPLVPHVFHWLPLTASALQFTGTALIVWGLKVTTNPDIVTFRPDWGEPLPSAGIVREHGAAATIGIWILLIWLGVQVIAALVAQITSGG